MGLFSKSKNNEELVAIFDIGSGSVGGAIARIPKSNTKKIPSIIASQRTEIKFRNELDFNIFLEDTLDALKTTAKAICDAKVGAPDRIECVLASPWYVSETRLIKLSREHSFVFDNKLANELLQKEISLLNDSYQKKYSAVESIPDVIEHHIMNITLNGYNVLEPYGKHTRSVEMNMALSLSPKICLDKIRKTLSSIFHHKPVSFSSFMVSSYLAVRDRYVTPDSYLLLDVNGEVTDVAVIVKGALKASLSFPFGRNTFFKYICTKLEIEQRDAKELFNLFTTNTVSDKIKKKVEPLFESMKKSWEESFRECINTLQGLIIPSTIFLTTDTDILDWFSNVIRNGDIVNSTVDGGKCTVVTLEGPEFLDMCSMQGAPCDPFLMIEAISIMRKSENI